MPKPKTVPVKLEKAEARVEEQPSPSNSQVAPELLASLKSASQLEEEAAQAEQEALDKQRLDYYKKKALFYVGVFGAVGILYLMFNYSKKQPDSRYVQELVNAIGDAAGK